MRGSTYRRFRAPDTNFSEYVAEDDDTAMPLQSKYRLLMYVIESLHDPALDVFFCASTQVKNGRVGEQDGECVGFRFVKIMPGCGGGDDIIFDFTPVFFSCVRASEEWESGEQRRKVLWELSRVKSIPVGGGGDDPPCDPCVHTVSLTPPYSYNPCVQVLLQRGKRVLHSHLRRDCLPR